MEIVLLIVMVVSRNDTDIVTIPPPHMAVKDVQEIVRAQGHVTQTDVQSMVNGELGEDLIIVTNNVVEDHNNE